MWVNFGIKTKEEFEKWCADPIPYTNHFVPVFPMLSNEDSDKPADNDRDLHVVSS